MCRYGFDLDFVKVLDFGLVERRGEDDTRKVAGTPAFMAPETLVGGVNVDGRADVYALACTAYFLLTGHLVFDGDSSEVLIAHAKEPPRAPSTVTELDIPPALDQLILECLAKAPHERPPTAEALALRLDAIDVAPAWDTPRIERWWQRHAPAPRPEG